MAPIDNLNNGTTNQQHHQAPETSGTPKDNDSVTSGMTSGTAQSQALRNYQKSDRECHPAQLEQQSNDMTTTRHSTTTMTQQLPPACKQLLMDKEEEGERRMTTHDCDKEG